MKILNTRTIEAFVEPERPTDWQNYVFKEGIGWIKLLGGEDGEILKTFAANGFLPNGISIDYTYSTDPKGWV